MQVNRMPNLKKVIFIAPIGIGNVILLIPTIKECKNFLSDSKITVIVTNNQSKEILKQCPYVDEVIQIEIPTIKKPFHSLKLLVKLYQLRAEQFSISITAFPSNHPFYNLLAFAIWAKKRIVHSYPVRQKLYLSFLQNLTVPIKPLHDVEQNLNLLLPLGNSRKKRHSLEIWVSEEAKKSAKRFIKSTENDNQSLFIGIHAGSSTAHKMIYKRWSAEKLALLAQELIRIYPKAKFFLFGGKEEVELNKRIAEQVKTTPTIFFSKSIIKTAAVIEKMSLFICNDSSLSHIASALGVPTIAIFGPTDPKRTSPYGKNHILIRSELPCSPCWTLEEVGRRKACPYAKRLCLTELSVSSVKKRVQKFIDTVVIL